MKDMGKTEHSQITKSRIQEESCTYILTHWGWDEMETISQTFSNVFFSMKMFEIRLNVSEVCT